LAVLVGHWWLRGLVLVVIICREQIGRQFVRLAARSMLKSFGSHIDEKR
jgi:hypothetical protein